MKDILKIFGSYFALGFGTIAGMGAGMKVCEKLLDSKSKLDKEIEKEKEEINKIFEEAKEIIKKESK